jgi:hypothetical protein
LGGLSAELLGALGPAALAGLAVLLVLLGRLIPRSMHDQIVADKDKTIAVERQRADLLLQQNAELLEHARVTAAVIQALQAPDREAA